MISDMPWASLPFFWDTVGLSQQLGALFFSNTVPECSCGEKGQLSVNHIGHCSLLRASNQIVCEHVRAGNKLTTTKQTNKTKQNRSEGFSLEVHCGKGAGNCPSSLAELKGRKKCIGKTTGGKNTQFKAALIGSCWQG